VNNLLADPQIRVLLAETFAQRRAVLAAFVVINLIALVLAFVFPKFYTASTTILVTERNVIQPLMQGAAATTDVTDRAQIAHETINGDKVMTEVVQQAGWVGSDTSADERTNIIQNLNKRIVVSNPGKNLIQIQFRDRDPQRAFLTAKVLADTFIAQSLNAKAAESQGAFEFIDKQTEDYHAKLTQMEERLKDFQIANIDVRPGSEGDISSRLNALQTRMEQAGQELSEALTKKKSLENQLSGEAEVATTISRETQYRQKIADLNNQLETLRLSYHDTYPDIIRIRHQIDDLKDAIEQDRKQRQAAKAAGQVTIDDTVINNPMYLQLKRDLSQVQTQIDTLNARIAETDRQLHGLLEQGKRVHGGEATLAELTRDYQATRDIYQDLLRRRENARVSMNMDKENQGLTFKVQEPATIPLQPSGLQFWQFLVLGVLAGISLPIGAVYAMIQLDPRVRLPQAMAERHQLPVIVTVAHDWSPKDRAALAGQLGRGLILIAALGGVLAVGVVLRVAGVA